MLKVLPRRLKAPVCRTIALRRPRRRPLHRSSLKFRSGIFGRPALVEVVSNKMEKTIVVAVVRRVPHAKFGKIVKRTKKLYAHDEKNQCAIGDLVRVEETRPLSRLKRWQLVEVLKH